MYSHGEVNNSVKKRRRWPYIVVVVILLAGAGFLGYWLLSDSLTLEEKIELNLKFDSTVTAEEQETVKNYALINELEVESEIVVSASVDQKIDNNAMVNGVYVPVTNFNSVRQKVTSEELKTGVNIDEDINDVEKSGVVAAIGLSEGKVAESIDANATEEEAVTIIDANSLSGSMKLLALDDVYYLDLLTGGAFFREIEITGDSENLFDGLGFAGTMTKDEVFKANMTGVTALTRVMMKKLATVKDPLYFSEKIGEFLADADLTHVSNEVSFKDGCSYSNTLFCSPPEFIETLKASGVDLVELTGNHNNDLGSEFNTNTINLYNELGWGTVGGGLNNELAAKPFTSDDKDSIVTFLAYNFPDSPNGGAISRVSSAGANSFEFARIESDIETAKQYSDFVIVNVQYWECYAYPDGYVEYPICDKPIGEQEANFKRIVDLGADMVVGSSAHQPQTYELYKGKPIYYGLGNLYFDQTSWPGTERGIVLTHYFRKGELLQTKLTPTVYDRDLQTRKMTDKETNYLLTRLHDAR